MLISRISVSTTPCDVLRHGDIIGGVDVSGSTVENDHEVAAAAAKAIG